MLPTALFRNHPQDILKKEQLYQNHQMIGSFMLLLTEKRGLFADINEARNALPQPTPKVPALKTDHRGSKLVSCSVICRSLRAFASDWQWLACRMYCPHSSLTSHKSSYRVDVSQLCGCMWLKQTRLTPINGQIMQGWCYSLVSMRWFMARPWWGI